MRDRHLLVVLSTIFAVRGGIPRFNQMLCLALDRLAPQLGLRVTVVSQDDTDDDYRRAGSPWQCLRLVPGRGPLRLAVTTLGRCIRERPDLMLIGLMGMSPVGVLCRPWVRGGFGFVAHGLDIWDETRTSRLVCGRRARFALAVSNFTAQAVHDTVGLAAERIQLLPNTLDPGFHSQPDESAGEPQGPLELLTVSRLDAQETMKGVDHTIRAFAEVGHKHPDARHRIVGHGSDKPRLQELARSLGVGDRVIFEEGLSDDELAQRYRNCSLFVMPSGQEGFGIVFLEAMRFGKPCIGGDAGGTPDVIVDGETGYLVPFADVPALVSALDRLLGDPELRRRLGRSGGRRLEQRFVFDRYQERVGEILRDLLPPR